jgi:hypothetical protein
MNRPSSCSAFIIFRLKLPWCSASAAVCSASCCNHLSRLSGDAERGNGTGRAAGVGPRRSCVLGSMAIQGSTREGATHKRLYCEDTCTASKKRFDVEVDPVRRLHMVPRLHVEASKSSHHTISLAQPCVIVTGGGVLSAFLDICVYCQNNIESRTARSESDRDCHSES